MHSSLFRLILIVGLLGVPGISSAVLGLFDEEPDAEVRKVKIFKLDLSAKVFTTDPMIQFERRYRLHGAVTSEEYYEREGKYFTVFWRTEPPQRKPGMVVRFEYLAATTGDEIHVKELTIDNVEAHNTTDIAITGEEFEEMGEILAWKVSLVRDGEVVADAESYLWD